MTDKLLFTPGPLTTSATVKSAMLRDAGSRDRDFIQTVLSIRSRLLALGGAAPGKSGYECILMQGSGTVAWAVLAKSEAYRPPLLVTPAEAMACN